MPRSNRKVVPESRESLKQLQFEIAAEFGLYGPISGSGMDTEFASELGMGAGAGMAGRTPYLGHLTSRDNGSVGGEITKRLVRQAEQALFQ